MGGRWSELRKKEGETEGTRERKEGKKLRRRGSGVRGGRERRG